MFAGAQADPPVGVDNRRDADACSRFARDARALLRRRCRRRAGAAPIPTRVVHATGQIVPIPASVPHEAGDMVDRRIVPDLRWIAKRYPIYVTDGYSGPLPDGEHVGCDACHVRDSDHYNGLAVDIVPLGGDAELRRELGADHPPRPLGRADARTSPVPPFRWVGYDGDAGHGCGNHLHLSWNHAPAPSSSSPNGSKCSPSGRRKSRRSHSRSQWGRRRGKAEAVPRRRQPPWPAPPKGPRVASPPSRPAASPPRATDLPETCR